MRTFAKLIVVVLLAGIAWTLWAAAAFYDLAAGLQGGDAITLERRIDWASVRQALREDLQASPVATAGGHTIDAMTSECAVATLLLTAKLDGHGWNTTARPPDTRPAFDWSHIRYAFYAGSPLYFRVDLKPDGDKTAQPLVLLFRWSGDWRLVRIFLPAGPATSALARHDDPSAAPPLPPGAERATFYEETSSDPNGRHSDGSVIWRTEQTPSVAGGAPDLALIAQVTVPQRSLDMTMTIRRNTDTTLPASHMIEVNFAPPPGDGASGIGDLVAIMMKPNEEAPGQHLAGSHAKVRDGFFMIGLSALDIDLRHNTELLKARPWFGITVRTNSGNRGVLVIEKGDTGDEAMAEAFAKWDASPAPASETTAQKR